MNDLHLSFRAQIPMSKKNALLNYGEIYLWSWRDASAAEQLRETIEHTALQDLMYASIHVSSEATLKSVMTVLDVFFSDKKNTEVASLLYRLYNPILWRSLSATNPMVRKNAVRILEKIFPLHDPTTSETKNAMNKATKALDSALQDKDTTVRIIASESTAKIAALFWDALPASAIRSLLNRKLSFKLSTNILIALIFFLDSFQIS
jgi:condensin-2 complex subunit G2